MTTDVKIESTFNLQAYKTTQVLKVLTEQGDCLWERSLDGYHATVRGVRIYVNPKNKMIGLNGKTLMNTDFSENPIFSETFVELENAINASFEISLEDARQRILNTLFQG